MRQPKNYDKALYACQIVVTATYLTIGIVVYYFCGQYLANPALGSAGESRPTPLRVATPDCRIPDRYYHQKGRICRCTPRALRLGHHLHPRWSEDDFRQATSVRVL